MTSAPFSLDDFARALEQNSVDFQRGQVVRGKVYDYSNDGVWVDIGGKSAAFLPAKEASLQPVLDLQAALPQGEEFEFLVVRDQNADGQVTISIRALELRRAWTEVEDLKESGKSVSVKVTGTNKGGVTVDLRGLRGFIPRSHLNEKENLDSLVGQHLSAVFLEVNPADRKLVLSERLAVRSARFSELEVGQLVSGKVSGFKPFGVFVDLDGTTALLHINQISNQFVKDLATVFQPGQAVQALIVAMDESRGRISLSTKVLENFPGEMLENAAEVIATAADRAERARKQLTAG